MLFENCSYKLVKTKLKVGTRIILVRRKRKCRILVYMYTI